MTIGIIWALVVFTILNITITCTIVRGEGKDYTAKIADRKIDSLIKKLGFTYLSGIGEFISRGDVWNVPATKNEIIKTAEEASNAIRKVRGDLNLVMNHIGVTVQESKIERKVVKTDSKK